MHAVREGRASRAKRRNKPRTIADKLEIYERDIAPALARKIIYDGTERDLIKLVENKGKTAKVRANRLAPSVERGRALSKTNDKDRWLRRFPNGAHSAG